MRIEILEQDGDTFELRVEGARAEITVITEMRLEGTDLVLRGLHVDGPGPGSSSVPELRDAARGLGRQRGASRVIIHGGRRTTGANPGRIPRPIVIHVDD